MIENEKTIDRFVSRLMQADECRSILADRCVAIATRTGLIVLTLLMGIKLAYLVAFHLSIFETLFKLAFLVFFYAFLVAATAAICSVFAIIVTTTLVSARMISVPRAAVFCGGLMGFASGFCWFDLLPTAFHLHETRINSFVVLFLILLISHVVSVFRMGDSMPPRFHDSQFQYFWSIRENLVLTVCVAVIISLCGLLPFAWGQAAMSMVLLTFVTVHLILIIIHEQSLIRFESYRGFCGLAPNLGSGSSR